MAIEAGLIELCSLSIEFNSDSLTSVSSIRYSLIAPLLNGGNFYFLLKPCKVCEAVVKGAVAVFIFGELASEAAAYPGQSFIVYDS